ncbi:hypothetical protein [Sphingobium vermicomposti]|uniref:Uncharacterized protein n=1 Tax=Sphingobium vermicomposti TaxID=529005 RepID=A0A846M0F6_9SPHN|nr:hypothetical protein [Sphingobium vermicomposti]NIJ15529.1 hypothetical protein [Sphingobium vermicomposti]
MRGYISKIHPAGSAIAAVLALTSTYGYAQESPVSDVAPVVAVPPPASVPANSAPVPFSPVSSDAAASQAMVQPTPPVEARIAEARAAAEREAAEQNAKPVPVARPAPARTERSTRAAAPTVAPPAIERNAEPAPLPTASVAPAVTATDPVQATVAPAPVDDSAATTSWVLPAALGGGALLLLGLGAAAVNSRRRRVGTRAALDHPAYDDQPTTAPFAPAVLTTPAPAEMHIPIGAHGSLAAMVAAPPSAENPFLTPRKRMARARFLLAQQEKRVEGHSPSFHEVAPPQTIHAEPQQMQTVYRMGADRKRGMTFKPQTH